MTVMRRGPAPKPAHLKLIEGNPGKRRIPTNEVMPERGPMPEAPAFLTVEARGEWDRVAEQLYHLGLLTTVDIASLAAYCQAYGRWVAAEKVLAWFNEQSPSTRGLLIFKDGEKKEFVKNPVVAQAATAARDMVKYAAEFGLTPAARTRLAATEQAAPKNRFDGLV